MSRIPWNKGKKCPQLSGLNNGFFGKKHSAETLKKNSEVHKGKKPTPTQLRALKIGQGWMKGKQNERVKLNPQIFKAGEEHPNWKGGLRCWRGVEWKKLREKIKTRDKFKCVDCSSNKNLSVHHIIPYSISKNNSFWNLETLCRSCHARKDLYYTRFGEDKREELEIDSLTIKAKGGAIKIYTDFNDKEATEHKILKAFEARKFAQMQETQ
ncbi:MAG: HNH endonuclease [Nanoarchaeota archaeon]